MNSPRGVGASGAPIADREAHHRAAVPQQRGAAAVEVHDQVRARRPVGAERAARHPAGGPVGQRRQPDAEPQLAVGTVAGGRAAGRCSSSPRACPRAAFRRRGRRRRAGGAPRRRAARPPTWSRSRGAQRHGRPDRDRGLRRSRGGPPRARRRPADDAAGEGDAPPRARPATSRIAAARNRPAATSAGCRRASSRELRLASAARLHDEVRVLDDPERAAPSSAARRTRRRRA